eukprot:g6972.t1
MPPYVERRPLFQTGSLSQEQEEPVWYHCTEQESESVAHLTETGRCSVYEDQEAYMNLTRRISSHLTSSSRPQDIEVRPFEVEYVHGINKNSSSPLQFDERGFAAYVAGAYVILFNWQSNFQVQHLTWRQRNRALSTLAMSSDNLWIAAGELGVDPLILMWNMETATPTEYFELRGHRSSISAVEFSPNGRFLASLGDVQDSQLIIWDCQNGVPILMQNLEVCTNLTALSFSSDSKSLFTVTGKAHFMVWNFNHRGFDSRTGRSPGLSLSSKQVLPQTEKAIDFVAVKTIISGKSSFVFALNQHGLLYKLRLQSGSCKVEKKIDLRVSNVYSMSISASRIAVSCGNGIVKLIRLKNLTTEAVFSKQQLLDQKANSADITPDAKYCAFDHTGLTLAVVYSDNSLVFWDIEDTNNIQPRRIIQSHSGPISDIVQIPSYLRDQDHHLDRSFGRTMRSPSIQDPQDVDNEFATCSDKGVINLWNLRLHRTLSRQMSYLSSNSDYSGGSVASVGNNLKVEIGLRSILLNPPLTLKSRASARKGKIISTSMSSKKISQTSVSSSTSVQKTKRSAAKKSPPKKEPAKVPRTVKDTKSAPKRTGTGLKSTSTKSKNLSKTAAPVRLSTNLSHSKTVKTPGSNWKDSVVTVQQDSGSHSGTMQASGSQTEFVDNSQSTCLCVSPNGLQLVVGDDKGQLRILNLANGEVIHRKKIHSSPITTLQFSPPGKDGELLLAVGAEDGSVNIIDVKKGFEIVVEKKDHEEPITGISFSPDGTTVVSCAKDKYIYFDSLEEVDYVSDSDSDEDDFATMPYFSRHCLFKSEYKSMHFNSARQTYMVGCDDNLIRVYNTAGQYVHSLRIPEELGAPIKILQGPVQSMVITCHATNQFCVFEYFTGTLLAIGESHDRLTGAIVINKGRSLLTTSEDGIMVIWKLDDGLIELCRSLPIEANGEKVERGYANDIFDMIENERQRSAAVVGALYEYPAIKSRNLVKENAPSLASISIAASSSPLATRRSSFSETGLPMSSVGGISRVVPLSKKVQETCPSWVNNGENLRREIFRSDFESVSPSSVPQSRKLELPYFNHTTTTITDDSDNSSYPGKISHNHHQLLQTGFSDHEGLPIEGFSLLTHSQPSLSVDEDYTPSRRYRSPLASREFSEFKNSRAPSMDLDLDHTASLASYQDHYDVRDDQGRRRSDSMDVPWTRPTGPEPPSSVSCDSGSRRHITLGTHARYSIDSQFTVPVLESPTGEATDRTRVIYPYASSPIGPNIYKRLSKSPSFIEEKRACSRLNSEEHVDKMLGELLAIDSDSESVFLPETTPKHLTFHWHSAVWEPESIEDRCSSVSEEEMPLEDICPPVDQPPAIVARAGGHLKDNPLYSSGSESSEQAFIATKRFPAMYSPFAMSSIPIEESFSSSECDQGPSSLPSASSAKDMLRTSKEDFMNLLKSHLCETLEKIQEDPSRVFGVPKAKLGATPRRQEAIDEIRQQILSTFGQYTRKSPV